MATDSNIPFMSQVQQVDPFAAFTRGVAFRDSREDRARAKELQPVEDRIKNLAIQGAEIDLNTAEDARKVQQAILADGYLQQLEQTQDPGQQKMLMRELESKIGYSLDIDGDGVPDQVTPENIQAARRELQPWVAAGTAKAQPNKPVEGLTYTDENGESFNAFTRFDATGNPTPILVNANPNGSARPTGKLSPQNSGGTTVNIGEGPGELAKQIARGDADALKEITAQAETAQDIMAQLEVARAIDVETGSGEDYKLAAREIGSALGFPVDEGKISTAQSFNAAMQGIVNNRLTQEKGPQTDQDVERFKLQFAQLTNPEDSKQFLLNYASALQERKIEQSEFYDEWLDKNPNAGSLRGARRGWRDYINDNKLISNKPSPATGLPVFYYEYERAMREANPQISDADIRAKWRTINK